MTRNSEKLLSFARYCIEHPDERFWQALRNWSTFSFIFGWNPRKPITLQEDGNHLVDGLYKVGDLGLEDTFYFE